MGRFELHLDCLTSPHLLDMGAKRGCSSACLALKSALAHSVAP
jgi:hypothetical protein